MNDKTESIPIAGWGTAGEGTLVRSSVEQYLDSSGSGLDGDDLDRCAGDEALLPILGAWLPGRARGRLVGRVALPGHLDDDAAIAREPDVDRRPRIGGVRVHRADAHGSGGAGGRRGRVPS